MPKVNLRVNSRSYALDVDPADTASLHPSQRPDLERPSIRLRNGSMWRVHSDRGRKSDSFVHHARVISRDR